MLGATRIAGADASDLHRDLIERLALHRAKPGRSHGEHSLQRLRDGGSVGEVAVRRLMRFDQLVAYRRVVEARTALRGYRGKQNGDPPLKLPGPSGKLLPKPSGKPEDEEQDEPAD